MHNKHILTLLEAWKKEKDKKEKETKATILLQHVCSLDDEDKLQLLSNSYDYTKQVVERDTEFAAWRKKKEHLLREWELKLLSLVITIGGLLFVLIWFYGQITIEEKDVRSEKVKHVIETIERMKALEKD